MGRQLTDRDRDYVMAQAFACFFAGMMLITYGATHSSMAQVIIGGLFWILAIFFAVASIHDWLLGKALQIMRLVSVAIFLASLALVIVDWSKSITEIASDNLTYQILLWGGIGFFYLFALMFAISSIRQVFRRISTLFRQHR
jgi:hypothetical protein